MATKIPQAQRDQRNIIAKIERIIEEMKLPLEKSGSGTQVFTIKWPTAPARAQGYPIFLEKLDTQTYSRQRKKINYELKYKTKTSSLKSPYIELPQFPKSKMKKLWIQFKYTTRGASFSDSYKTEMGESLVAWKLAYLLNGGTEKLTEESLRIGSDDYNEFNSKIGNHVSSWNNQRLMQDCIVWFSIDPKWQRSINATAAILKKNITFRTVGAWRIERPDSLPKTINPYDIYNKSSSKLRMTPNNDKWNPGDIWFMNKDGENQLTAYSRDFSNQKDAMDSLNDLNDLNGMLIHQYNLHNIVGMSLKKVGDVDNGYNVQFKLVNSKNYFDEEVELDTSKANKGIELKSSNQDISFFLKIRKVERDPKTENVTKRYPWYNANNTFLKLKTKAGGYRLELNIKGTEARHGSIGTKGYQSIIWETDRTGVNNLRSVQKEYPDLQFGRNATDQFLSFDITSNTTPSLMGLVNGYMEEIFNYVNDDSHVFEMQSKPDWMQSKVIASELGYVVKSTGRKETINSIVENLYRIAASSGMVYGTTSEIKKILKENDPKLSGVGEREIVMNSSIHAKVY